MASLLDGFASKIANNIDYLHIVAHEMASKEPKPDIRRLIGRDSQMNKTAGKDRAPGIGLATEHRLPEAFKARTDADANTVEITSPTSRPLNVATNSFASVANALAVFAPTGEATLEPGHRLKLVDDFSGREVTLTANTLIDVAAALQTFAVSRGKYLPSAGSETGAAAPAVAAPAKATAAKSAKTAPPVAAAPEPATAAPVAPAVAEAKKQKTSAKTTPAKTAKAAPAKATTAKGATAAKTSGKSKKAPPVQEAAPAQVPEQAAPAPVKAEKPAKASPKPKAAAAAPKAAGIPDWAKDMPGRQVDGSGGFLIEARTLALPKERAKVVSGVSDGSQENTAFGYEVLQGAKSGGKHLGWIIAEDAKSLIVTGFGDLQPSKHANLNAALIRIRVTNLPRLLGA
jgi:hypothetical protein